MAVAGGASGEGAARRPTRLRRLVRLVLAGGALLVVAYSSRGYWLAPLLARWAEKKAREELGAELVITRVAELGWRELVLEGVRWRAEGSALRRVDDARIVARYSFFSGDPTELEVTARGVELELRSSDSSGQAIELPELGPSRLELSDVVLHWEDAAPLRLKLASAAGSLSDDVLRLESLVLATGENGARFSGTVPLASVPDMLRASGRLELALPDAPALLGAFGRETPLRSASLDVRVEAGRASLTGDLALDGG